MREKNTFRGISGVFWGEKQDKLTHITPNELQRKYIPGDINMRLIYVPSKHCIIYKFVCFQSNKLTAMGEIRRHDVEICSLLKH